MVDFRKWLVALAVVGLLLAFGSTPANAQSGGSFICQATSGVPNNLRSEGITELLGDLTLNCTGGTPTPNGQAVPLNNIEISINTNITSRVESNSGLSEALLMIDEPYPTVATEYPAQPIGFTAKQQNALGQLACQATNSTNCAITSKNPTANGVIGQGGNYDGTPGHYNIFQGFVSGQNAISWNGVPIDAPGTTGQRVIRITNIRANAFALGVSSTLVPTSVNMIVSVSGNSQISIFQPGNGNVVGEIRQGLIGSNTSASYQQCLNLNALLLHGTPSSQNGPINLKATEGFAAAFKPQSFYQTFQATLADTLAYTGPGSTNLTTALQNIPGFNYDSESGFYPGTGTGLTNLAQSGSEPVGLADRGTQIQFTLAGVGAGVTLWAPPYVYLDGNYGPGVTAGVAVLTSASFTNGGAITSGSSITIEQGPEPVGGWPVPAPVQLAISGSSASITYEIYYADPSVNETLNVQIQAAYITTGPTSPSPTTTPVTASINYAPLSSVGTGDSTDPIPRFGQPYAASNLFTINLCSCNLLFPFVTNTAGFDTGVAIANTTADTLNGLSPQSGPVTLTYYGTTTGGGAAPSTQTTTSSVPSGSELVFTLSSGGNYGILATPGFEGYIIARASFQYCHGYAEITDQGAQRLGSGYLALSLDIPFGAQNLTSRSNQYGENTAH